MWAEQSCDGFECVVSVWANGLISYESSQQTAHAPSREPEMPLRSRLPRLALSVATAALVLVSSALMAALGGFLNHCRGGYVHFGPTNLTPGTPAYHDWYWPQHILARLLYAIPTGIVLVSENGCFFVFFPAEWVGLG